MEQATKSQILFEIAKCKILYIKMHFILNWKSHIFTLKYIVTSSQSTKYYFEKICDTYRLLNEYSVLGPISLVGI